MRRKAFGGYVGLLALLITALLVALLFWRMDLFSGTQKGNGISPVEQDVGAIKAAQNATQQIETRYTQQTKEIGN